MITNISIHPKAADPADFLKLDWVGGHLRKEDDYFRLRIGPDIVIYLDDEQRKQLLTVLLQGTSEVQEVEATQTEEIVLATETELAKITNW